MEQQLQPMGEIKGNFHRTMTFNERMAILFYMLDKDIDELSNKSKIKRMKHVTKQLSENVGVLMKLGLRGE